MKNRFGGLSVEETLALEMRNVHKKFPGVYALDSARLEVRRGEVHALLGENGAGKSTLIKVLGGIYPPKEGEIYVEGERVEIADVRDAQRLGISIIHQELLLVPQMSVADNIFLGSAPGKYGYVDRRDQVRRAQAIIDDLGLPINAAGMVCTLSVAQQQLVEIIKAISFKAKIIVMDEPTSSLSSNEAEILFGIIRRLKEQGVAIIYISHRMEELFTITDRVTVMRDGKTIGTLVTGETTVDEAIRLMVGRELSDYYVRTDFPKGDVVLQVDRLGKEGVFSDISFELRKGEILGFAGLVGAGRTELMTAIFGVDPYDSGTIRMNGREVPIRSPGDAMRAGIALVPENRKEQGLVLKNTVGFNMTLTVLKEFIAWLRVNRRSERLIMDEYRSRFSIRTPSYQQIISNLSGGNQQKVVVSKWLATRPAVLILDEPTRGIDVGAKSEIYSIINELTLHDMAIIMVSSEMQEVMAMSDRICVMGDGRIKTILDKRDYSQERILAHAIGGIEQ
jgi:ribose transport system ATP-binding protein/inositol transport system ATP-binding protein